jgi:hypothetical protein
MADTVVNQPEVNQEQPVVPVNPFADNVWKSEPTIKAVEDPAIKEKDEKIKEEKPEIVKPNEPSKTPGATPEPIQDRPTEDKPKPKEEAVATPEPLKFANEESERLFNLLKEGKTEDVYSVLHEQRVLGSIDKMPADEVIKLSLQYKNKDFSHEDINDLFNERYAVPEKPEQELTDTTEEYEAKLAKHEKEVQKIKNRIERDAKPAKTELLALKKEIVLPDIPKEVSKAPEPTQEELEAAKKAKESFLNVVSEQAKNFNGYSATFKDEEVEIPVAYKVTEEEKAALQPLLSSAYDDLPAFFNQLGWVDKSGQINVAKLQQDLHLITNKEKVIAEMVTETGKLRHKESIKAIKNIDYSGGNKSNGDLGATPEEKQKAMVTHFFNS